MFQSMKDAIKAIDTTTTRMKEAIGTIEGALVITKPCVSFDNNIISIKMGVDRNGTIVTAVESFILDLDGETASTSVSVTYAADDGEEQLDYVPNVACGHGTLVELIKKHTMPPRIEWDMSAVQFIKLKDCLRRMDSDGRSLGAVNIGCVRLEFQVEPRRDRMSNEHSDREMRIGTLLVASKDVNPYIGTLPDGTRYTDLGDFLLDAFEAAMNGHYEVNPNDGHDYSLLTYPVFKEQVERWIYDMVRKSEQYEAGTIDSSVFREDIPAWTWKQAAFQPSPEPSPDRFDEILAKFSDEAKKITEQLTADFKVQMDGLFEKCKKQLQ